MRNWVVGGIILILLGVFIKVNSPVKAITFIENNDFSSVYINGNMIEDVDLVSDLMKVLLKYEAFQTTDPFPVESKKIKMEIDYLSNEKPRHILLGDVNVIYESGDTEVFEIINSHELLNELTNV